MRSTLHRIGLVTLIASNVLNVITCAAEIGGLAILLHLLTGWPERILLVGSALALAAIIYLCSFQWIERSFGFSGLLMIVFAVSAVALHPDRRQLAAGFNPVSKVLGKHAILLYAYSAVGMFSAMLMEYEVHFYSSGAIEEDWKLKDLGENFMVASLGSILGSLLAVALLGAIIFLPRHIFRQLLNTAVMAGSFPYAGKVLVLALLGAMACIAGAAIETAMSGAYNVCQFYNLDWGKCELSKDDCPIGPGFRRECTQSQVISSRIRVRL